MPLLIIRQLQRKCKKNAKIFGQFKKKQYLCTRFRSKNGVYLRKEHKQMIFEKMSIHNKIVVQETITIS